MLLCLLWCNTVVALDEKTKNDPQMIDALVKYRSMANAYAELAKKRGINAEAYVVKGGHDGKLTLIKYGKEIIREALK